MKKTSLSIILLLALLAAISNAYAQSGPPPMQEVEATGQAADADAAFKQAVNDAVRQVVGTLVSAENVVNNERVIKDQVLTLSDGFVEKVLNQDKTKLDDGTWQVKLKCIVRKGQLYGRLQEVKVPTVKFEGVSLFADVVSQQTVEKDSAALLAEAFLGWNGSMYEAVSLSSKPEIIEKSEETITRINNVEVKTNEATVQIRMSCRVTLNRAVYEKQFLAKLTNVLETLAMEKEAGNINPRNDFKMFKSHFQQHWHDHQKVICIDGATDNYVVKDDALRSILRSANISFFNSESDTGSSLHIFAVFRDSAGSCLLIRDINGGKLNRVMAEGTTYFIVSPSPGNSDARDFNFDASIPMKYLSRITKIELHVATALDGYLTSNKLPLEANGGFVYRDNKNTGWLWKFVKASDKRNFGNEFFYIPTLQMGDSQSEEFNTKTK